MVRAVKIHVVAAEGVNLVSIETEHASTDVMTTTSVNCVKQVR